MRWMNTGLMFCLVLAIAMVSSERCLAQATTKIGDIEFTLAPGLTVTRVATEPLVKWPIVADWDSDGRLVVVESGGAAKPIVEHNKLQLHRIVRLIDDDHDGQFDRRIVAADNLPFSEGILCRGDSMLVAAPPHILKLTDTDGDGVCEEREVWFDGQTITGCANDLHGPYMGRDGWIYWCKGAFAEQTHALLDGTVLTDKAAHIYRRKWEGGPIEPVMSGGMDNPVEVAFTPEGERFFTSTFLQHPGNGLRDGIVHAIYGGVYGKEHHAIDGLVRTGPLMPIMTQLGPAAPSGLTCLVSDRLVASSTENEPVRTLVAALFNMQKVTAHRLHPASASFRSEDIDLLVGDRVDFHPTDILEDTDGSLLVVDTGGWYDLCCPTSRIDQKTASGGIYRLRRAADENLLVAELAESFENQGKASKVLATSATAGKNANRPATDLEQASVAEAIAGLRDDRPWTRRMANKRLGELGNQAIASLESILVDDSSELPTRLNALWALCNIGTDEALAALLPSLSSTQPSLIQAACHAVSVHRYQPARPLLEAIVGSSGAKSPSIIRAATEGLGRIGTADSIAALMERASIETADPVLRHSLLYAMMEINSAESVARFLDSESNNQRAATMIVLDKIGEKYLEPQYLLRAIAKGVAAERTIAIDILCHHPEWSGETFGSIANAWEMELSNNRDPGGELLQLFSAWKNETVVQEQVGRWIAKRGDERWNHALRSLLSNYEGSAPPKSWIGPLIGRLRNNPRLVAPMTSDLDLSQEYCRPLIVALRKSVRDANDVDAQLELVGSLPKNHSFKVPELAQEAAARYSDIETGEAANGQRQVAEQALRRLRIDESIATMLVRRMEKLPPRDLQTTIEIVSSARRDPVDLQMLNQLRSLPAARALPVSFLGNVYRRRSEELRKLATETTTILTEPTKDIALQVDAWADKLSDGDAVRGLQVFRSKKAACSACHQMGYIGGEVGPELTRIGNSRTYHALLEAVLFPSSRLEQSYQPTKVLTVDGQVHNGLIKHRNTNAIELQLSADKTIVIKAEDVERMEPSTVSIMPSGMKDLLTQQELADLLALLESAK